VTNVQNVSWRVGRSSVTIVENVPFP